MIDLHTTCSQVASSLDDEQLRKPISREDAEEAKKHMQKKGIIAQRDGGAVKNSTQRRVRPVYCPLFFVAFHRISWSVVSLSLRLWCARPSLADLVD